MPPNKTTPPAPPALTVLPPPAPPVPAAEAPRELTPEEIAEQERQQKEALQKAQALVTRRTNELLPEIQQARELAKTFRDTADQIDAAAGNLEGSIITARDINRHDPVRAGERLREASAAFVAAAKKFPLLK